MHTTVQLLLSDSLFAFVKEQTTTLGYASPAEYIVALLKAEQRKKAKEKLEALLLEGFNSGPAAPMTAEDWDGIRRRVKQRLAEAKANRSP